MIRCARDGCGRRSPSWVAAYLSVGAFVDHRWFCSTRCVEQAVKARLSRLPAVEPAWVQGWLPVKLGTLLSRQVGLTRESIAQALEIQSRSGTPIGQTLKSLGAVTPDDLLRALATQAGVRYLTTVDPDMISRRPGGLPHNTVTALGIVPVAADPKRREFQVACTAPIPGFAVRALSRLTRWAVEPLLVSDETMPHLVELYAGTGAADEDASGIVCDAEAGAAMIARIARSRRRVRLRHERCDPYVWVRLEGGGFSDDVLLPMAAAGR